MEQEMEQDTQNSMRWNKDGTKMEQDTQNSMTKELDGQLETCVYCPHVS
jgi:hypothetical protein